MTRKRPRVAPASPSDWRRLHHSGRPPRLLVDSELRAFVDKALESMSFTAIAKAARKRFGIKRAPSKSTIHRYWQRYRKPQLSGRSAGRGRGPR